MSKYKKVEKPKPRPKAQKIGHTESPDMPEFIDYEDRSFVDTNYSEFLDEPYSYIGN